MGYIGKERQQEIGDINSSFHNLNGVLSVVVAPHIAHKADELRYLVSWREEGCHGQLIWGGGLRTVDCGLLIQEGIKN